MLLKKKSTYPDQPNNNALCDEHISLITIPVICLWEWQYFVITNFCLYIYIYKKERERESKKIQNWLN